STRPGQPFSVRQVREFFAKKGAITEGEIDKPTPHTLPRMIHYFYNDMGGYVPHDQAVKLMHMRASDGRRAVRFDATASLRLHARAVESIELATVIRDFFEEASRFDPLLRENVSKANL